VFLSNPVYHLRMALMFAQTCDLAPVQKPCLNFRCPRPAECKTYLFQQTWDATSWTNLGTASKDPIITDTIVVIGPQGDACVYIGDSLAYRIVDAVGSDSFRVDLETHQMAAPSEAGARYGVVSFPADALARSAA
jgi:hypothetical protein